MLKGRVFKRLCIAFSTIVLLGYFLYQAFHNVHVYEQKVIKEQKINDFTTLYVTEGSAGATTNNTYKYYLYPSRSTAKFEKEMYDYEPMLFTDDANVGVTVKDSKLYLTVRGRIYSFTNQQDEFIHLDASSY